MKKMILGAAFAAMLASPALAQSYDPQYGTGNTFSEPARELSGGFATGSVGAAQAYAEAPALRRGLRAQAYAPDPAYSYGAYAGTDPDPNIRFQLRRDPPGRD